MNRYPFAEVEPRWQRFWEARRSFRALDHSPQPKFYCLDMFPYPSGAGLHVGHVEGYTATDIVSRYRRMRGYNVLHPMGWEAFGLPAEQYAMKTGIHPAVTTAENITTFRRQMKRLGLSYDWDREVNTTDPDYYRWTQWIFARLYERGLAYVAEIPVNWCPELGTVLANEEVVDGKSELGGFDVVRRPMRQWVLKITAYADRLLADLDLVDWPPSTLEMQRNWIGRSVGADVDFPLVGAPGHIRVFTTRPDTLFGATYMVLAPEHPLVPVVTDEAHRAAIEAYREAAARKSDLQRTELAREKTGVFTGGLDLNPVNGEMPGHQLLRILLPHPQQRHRFPAGIPRGRDGLPSGANPQRDDPPGPGELRRRLQSYGVAAVPVSERVSLQAGSHLRWRGHRILAPQGGRATLCWGLPDSSADTHRHVCVERPRVHARV